MKQVPEFMSIKSNTLKALRPRYGTSTLVVIAYVKDGSQTAKADS